MRQTRLMLLIVMILSIGLVSLAAAQMMGGNDGHSTMNKADSSSHSGMMGKDMTMKMGSMMGDMSKNCKMMSSDFEKIEAHFDKMMQMKDMNKLKAEMQKHQNMMQDMHSNMSQQQSMCQNMMSMMNSGGMQGMMGKDSTQSGSTEQHDHNH